MPGSGSRRSAAPSPTDSPAVVPTHAMVVIVGTPHAPVRQPWRPRSRPPGARAGRPAPTIVSSPRRTHGRRSASHVRVSPAPAACAGEAHGALSARRVRQLDVEPRAGGRAVGGTDGVERDGFVRVARRAGRRRLRGGRGGPEQEGDKGRHARPPWRRMRGSERRGSPGGGPRRGRRGRGREGAPGITHPRPAGAEEGHGLQRDALTVGTQARRRARSAPRAGGARGRRRRQRTKPRGGPSASAAPVADTAVTVAGSRITARRSRTSRARASMPGTTRSRTSRAPSKVRPSSKRRASGTSSRSRRSQRSRSRAMAARAGNSAAKPRAPSSVSGYADISRSALATWRCSSASGSTSSGAAAARRWGPSGRAGRGLRRRPRVRGEEGEGEKHAAHRAGGYKQRRRRGNDRVPGAPGGWRGEGAHTFFSKRKLIRLGVSGCDRSRAQR